MCWQAKNAFILARSIIGATDPTKAALGTIRGDFGIVSGKQIYKLACLLAFSLTLFYLGRNLVHGSDSISSANKEIGLWFSQDEILEWQPALQEWIMTDE